MGNTTENESVVERQLRNQSTLLTLYFMNYKFKHAGTGDLKDELWCYFRDSCLCKFSLGCLSALYVQIQGQISSGAIALHVLISSKQAIHKRHNLGREDY